MQIGGVCIGRAVNKLQLNFGQLAVSLALNKRFLEGDGGPYFDWLHCTVDVRDPHFAGQFEWEVMPIELRQLADGLERMGGAAPEPYAFRCAEDHVQLDFTRDAPGAPRQAT